MIITIVFVLIVVCVSVPPLAKHYGNAQRYAKSFSKGESYEDIKKEIPWFLVFRKLHRFEETDISYVEREAKKLNIQPEYVMIINSRFVLFNLMYGYALFFDENQCFIDYGCSGK